MKNNLRITTVFIVFLLLALTFSCKKEVPNEIPTLMTIGLSSITSTSATGGGSIKNDGGATITTRGVCWSTNLNPTIADNKTSDGSGIGSFISSITGLIPGTTYYVRAYATNSVGTAYGNQLVTTTMATLPTITTIAATNITSSSVTTGGFISFDGGSFVIARGVCWSTSQNPTITDNKTANGTGSSSFISSISGLAPGTTYYIRAYATNSMGTTYGDQLTVTTLAIAPTITTTAISPITFTTATSGGNITSDGGANVTARGVCWSNNQNPTISNNKTTDGSGIGTFVSSITGLAASTTYYVRAYATNSVGTAYGSNASFTTETTITDIEGNLYYTVTIGAQIWMAENLKTTKYRNGNLIGTTTPASLDISTENTPKYQWAYAGDESNVATYGRLYTWYAVTDSRNVCPTGWHVPTDTEWTTLTTYLGGVSVAGGKLKEAGTNHWQSPNKDATNSSVFTALPGGCRFISSNFGGIYSAGIWWGSTEINTTNGVTRAVYNFHSEVTSFLGYSKANGFSVRCIKD